jgi:hypothetical protein
VQELATEENVTLIEHAESRGRSEAANAGVRAATTEFVCFLDDDDLFYEDHLVTLARAWSSTGSVIPYTDAISSYMQADESGSWTREKQLRQYEQDFDPELLLLDNYIPLPTLLLRRDDFLDLGGFDPALDLFEDWDFLLRLSSRRELRRVPRITCEVRHFPSIQSVVVATPEGSSAFRAAKLEIWRRIGSRLDQNVVANVFERRKAELSRTFSSMVESVGRGRHLEIDLTRVERDKASLLEERRELTSSLSSAHEDLASVRRQVAALNSEIEELQGQLADLQEQLESAYSEGASLRETAGNQEDLIGRLYAEIDRLNQLLARIYSSKAWRLHRTVEKLRGRGD